MSDFVIPAAPRTVLEVAGEAGVFPVRRVLCVGRNYAAHAREMGADAREPPFFFSKPADALVPAGRDPHYPTATADLQHEIELVIAIGAAGLGQGAAASPESALELVFGYAVGVDLTRRDLQSAAKAKGHPWESGKAFDDSAPIGAIRPWRGAPPEGRIWLSVNGEIRQDANVADMIWSAGEIIAQAARLWRLAPGDLIFTGTPEGVGPLGVGDRVTGGVDGVGELAFDIVP
jgi:fumarylpyruvate hydrolase